MHGSGWTILNILIFYTVSPVSAFRAIRFNAKVAIPRASYVIFAAAAFLWGTGWLFRYLRLEALEELFKVLGALLFIVNVPVMLIGKAQMKPPAA